MEIVPVLTIIVMLMAITIVALNPIKLFREARNVHRQRDVAYLADGIAEYVRDDRTRKLFLRIPTDTAMEICGDVFLKECSGLFEINELIDQYILEIPVDPLSKDLTFLNKNTRYFIIRTDQHFTVSAPDTEPAGAEVISVSR